MSLILSVIRNLNNTLFKKSKYSATFAMVLSDQDGDDKNLQTNDLNIKIQ